VNILFARSEGGAGSSTRHGGSTVSEFGLTESPRHVGRKIERIGAGDTRLCSLASPASTVRCSGRKARKVVLCNRWSGIARAIAVSAQRTAHHFRVRPTALGRERALRACRLAPCECRRLDRHSAFWPLSLCIFTTIGMCLLVARYDPSIRSADRFLRAKSTPAVVLAYRRYRSIDRSRTGIKC